MKKSFLSLAVLICVAISVQASAAISGNCGTWDSTTRTYADNCTWTYDEATKTLTFSGTGEIGGYNYMASNNWNISPWSFSQTTSGEYIMNEVTNIVINEGIDTIGTMAFKSLPTVTSVSLPDSLTTMKAWAFDGNTSLTSLELPPNLKVVEGQALQNTGITSIDIPEGVTAFGLSGMYKLETLNIPEGSTAVISGFDYTRLKTVVLPASLFEGDAELSYVGRGMSKVYCPDGNTKCAQLKGYHCGPTPNQTNWAGCVNTSVSTYIVDSDGLYALTDGNGNIITDELGNPVYYASSMDMQKGVGCSDRQTCILQAMPKAREVAQADGSVALYRDGKLVGFRGKRIYTVEEASMLSKDTGNTIKLRYK